VLGAHRHKGLADLVFGQTVTHVRHTVSIPVFVVPLSEPSGERPHSDFEHGR
jgi:nucleotide-binding universal stress UspA family protein